MHLITEKTASNRATRACAGRHVVLDGPLALVELHIAHGTHVERQRELLVVEDHEGLQVVAHLVGGVQDLFHAAQRALAADDPRLRKAYRKKEALEPFKAMEE